MRTTINLSDEACRIAREYAERLNISLSKAVSDLVMRGFGKRPRIRYEHGIPVFDESENGPKITTEMVKRLEAGEV
jgi:hypothetical protein